MTSSIATIIVAAGRGTRAGGGPPKQWRRLGGQPVLAHTLDALRAGGLTRLILVLHPDDMTRAQGLDLHGVTLVGGRRNAHRVGARGAGPVIRRPARPRF